MANAAVSAQAFAANPAGGGHNFSLYSSASVSTMQAKLAEITEGCSYAGSTHSVQLVRSTAIRLQRENIQYADYTYANEQKTTPALYEARIKHIIPRPPGKPLCPHANAVTAGRDANQQVEVNAWAADIFNARNALDYRRRITRLLKNALLAATR